MFFLLRKKQPLFFEDFSKSDGWEQTQFYNQNGNFSICTTFARSHGRCLKKESPNDPHGCFKILPKKIEGNFCFSGWLFSEKERHSVGVANRLALEDSSFSGYGFLVNHGDGRLCIERRDRAQAVHLSNIKQISPPIEKWYKFELKKKKNIITLSIMDDMGNEIEKISTLDDTFTSFDRVVVHGGSPYYIDDIEINSI